MKIIIALVIILSAVIVWVHDDFFKKEWGSVFNMAHAQRGMISASRVKEAMQDMDCKKVSLVPDVWTCEHARAFCIIVNPSNQAQMQCQFR